MANKAAIYTLGCKVNQTESDAMASILTEAGYKIVDFQDFADLYIINTCTVTHLGDRKSRQMIRRAKKTNPESVVTVTGCYAQTSPGEVLAIPGVDLIVGTRDRDKLVSLVEQTRAAQGPINAVQNIMEAREFEELPLARYHTKTRAFIKIQEGCNNFCSYCIIPYARGPLRSRRPENVISEVKQLVADGFKEVVLTGIHTGAYGIDRPGEISLEALTKDLADIVGLARLRLSSIEAKEITPELLEIFANSKNVCKHLHIPLQSGSDEILKKMNRKYTLEEYRRLVARVREKIPGIAITTDIITGFPGETSEHFNETLDFVREMAFSRLHVFKYSPRKGTPAAKFSGQISPKEKEERSKALIELGAELAENYARGFLGQAMEVLVEEKDSAPGDNYEGYTGNYLRVEFPSSQDLQGSLVNILLKEASGEKILGELI